MTKVTEKAQRVKDALNDLNTTLAPALSGNPEIDANRLVEQHTQLTASIVQLVKECTEQLIGRMNVIELNTARDLPVAREIREVTWTFNEFDKRILVGLARLQQNQPGSGGFSGKEILSSAKSLPGCDQNRQNCTHRLTEISILAPCLLTNSIVRVGPSVFRLTADGMNYANDIYSEICNASREKQHFAQPGHSG